MRFESSCSLEQVLADAAAAMADDGFARVAGRLRTYNGALATAMYGSSVPPTPLGADDIPSARDLRGASLRLERDGLATAEYIGPRWPECRSIFPLAYDAFYERARALAPSIDLVVGVRTGGSYLAPVVAAALAREGAVPRYVTVRPSSARAELAALRPVASSVLLVDDASGSGQTLRTCVDELRRALGADLVVRALVGHTDVGRTDAEVARPHDVVPAVRGYEVEREIVPFGRRYFAALAGLPTALLALPKWASVTDTRRRLVLKPLGEDGGGGRPRLVAKQLGFGLFADLERRRLRRAPAAPPLVGVRNGWMIEEHVEGDPVVPGAELGSHDLDDVLATTLFLWEERRALTTSVAALCGALGPLLDDLDGHLASEGATAVVATARAAAGTVPLVAAPTNQGGWHVIRCARTGRVVRLGQEVGHAQRTIDPVEDVLALAIELALGEHERRYLIEGYEDHTGERVDGPRLAAAQLGVALRGLAELTAVERAMRDVRRRRESSPAAMAPFLGRRSRLEDALRAATTSLR